MRVALYLRVSTDFQAEEGYSLDAQLSRLQMYCKAREWAIAETYIDDGYSAKNLDRPAVRRMMEDTKSGRFDGVLIIKLDRLTRSVLNLHQLLQHLKNHHIGLTSVEDNLDTESASGRLFMNIMASVAEWERETISERVTVAMKEMTKQGKWSGGTAPFGYRREDGKLTIFEPEAEIVREIFNRYIAGTGYVKLLQWLNDPDNPKLAPRERWNQNALKYILRNPLYAGNVRFGYRDPSGKRQHNYIVENGEHDAIIPQDLFDQAENLRLKRRTNPGRASNGTYVLSGILRCGLCGSSMSGWTKYRTNKNEGPPIRYYQCSERAHSRLCKMPMVKAELVEQMVLDGLRESYTAPVEVKPSEPKPNIDIAAELAKLKRQRDRWMEAYNAEAISIAELREQRSKIDRDEMHLRAMFEREKPSADPNEIRELMRTLDESWELFDPAVRKEMLQMVVERVELSPDKKIRLEYRE